MLTELFDYSMEKLLKTQNSKANDFIIYKNLFISLSSIFANKTRSILTALGITIGVVSVTMMGTLISGLDKTFENSMSWLGKDILYVSRYEWFGMWSGGGEE